MNYRYLAESETARIICLQVVDNIRAIGDIDKAYDLMGTLLARHAIEYAKRIQKECEALLATALSELRQRQKPTDLPGDLRRDDNAVCLEPKERPGDFTGAPGGRSYDRR